MALIKIQLKKNICYMVVYFFGLLIRKILCIIIKEYFEIKPSEFIFLYLMVLGEIFGGLLIYLYQYNSNRNRKKTKYFGINLIYNKKERDGDGKIKIVILIILASFFDMYNYTFGTMYFPYKAFSDCIDFRLSSTQTISSSLIFIYVLKYKMKRHHKFSLISLGACLFLTIVIDAIFKKDNITIGQFCFVYFGICFNDFCFTINNSIEKYLVDIDYMNPFQILSFQGICGVIFSILASIGHGALFSDIINFYNKCKENDNIGRFILLIFLLFLYFILSMIVNAYKVYANIIFLPMARALINYIFNPIFNIYFFVMKLDFNGNYLFFFLSEFICIFISFFGCIYNEYIILSCFKLDKETSYAIKERAIDIENTPTMIMDDISSNDGDD